MKKFFLIILCLSFFLKLSAQTDAKIPSGSIELFDGFENGNYWIWGGFDWDQYGDHKFSTGAVISKDWASEGKHSLKCPMDAMPKDSSISAVWFFDGTNDLTGVKYIVIDFYNPEKYTYTVSAVVQTTESWNWRETDRLPLPPGLHTIVYDVTEFSEELYDVRRICVTHNGKEPLNKPSCFYIDNIRFVK